MDLDDLPQMEFLDPERKAGNTLSVFPYAFWMESVIDYFHDGPVALLGITDCQSQVLVLTGEEREATFHDVIDIVFLREVLDNIRIQLVLGGWILDEVLVCRSAFLDFSILNLFRTGYYLVEIDLLYGQIKSILFIGGFHDVYVVCYPNLQI